MPNRVAKSGDTIVLDGTVIWTFGGGVALGVTGEDFNFSVAANPTPSTFVPEVRQAVAGTGAADVWLNGKVLTRLAPGRHLFNLPGNDLIIDVAPAGTPTPPVPVPPQPPPTPPQTPPAPDELPTPPPGVTIVRLTDLDATLTLRSNTWFTHGQGRISTVRASTGIRIPSGVVNCGVFGVNFVATDGNGRGVDSVWDAPPREVVISDCTFKGFGAGVRMHHKLLGSAPLSGWSRNVTLRRVRILDTTAADQKGGQGMYLQNIDGLTVEECFIDRAGMHKPARDIYTHGVYCQAGNRNVRFTRCFVNECESTGIQARGPLENYNDADPGTDPGPRIIGCVVAGTPIALMPNGPRAEIRDNVLIVGPHTNKTNTGGECGIYASVGKLKQTNNIVVSGPTTGSGTKLRAFQNNSRSDAAWAWNKPTGYVEDSGNVDRRDVRVDVTDLVARARSGEPVGPLVDAAQARVRAKV